MRDRANQPKIIRWALDSSGHRHCAAFTYSRRTGPNGTIRLAVIGAGRMGRLNVGVFLENPDAAIWLICDASQLSSHNSNTERLGGKAEAIEDYVRVPDRKGI